jgi:hypothetical protein
LDETGRLLFGPLFHRLIADEAQGRDLLILRKTDLRPRPRVRLTIRQRMRMLML